MNQQLERVAAFAVCFIVAMSAGAGRAAASDWASWLGPSNDGRSTGLGVEAGKPLGFDVRWKRELGKGYTGIAISGSKAVTMFADGTKDWVVAFDPATGAELWRYEIDAMYPPQGGSEGGPASMAIIAGDMVYGLGAKGHLFGIQLGDGKEVWKLRVDQQLGGRAPMFGYSTVPLVAGDVLFVQVGGDEGRSLVGFDRRTGKVLWSHGDDVAGYASPTLAKLGGVEQIVALTNRSLYGIAPATGKVLWSHEHGLVPEGSDSAGTPLAIDGARLFVNGEDPSKLFSVKPAGEGWEVRELWTTRAIKGSFATPVFHEGHLYGFDGDFLSCIDVADGAKVWKSRPPGGRGLILVDGRLLILANDGSIVAVEATPEGYREAGRSPATEAGSWTYPSFADGAIYVRNTVELAAISVESAPEVSRASLTSASAPRSEFERFVKGVGETEDKQAAVDRFIAAQKSFPVVEDGWVHFVYRGDVDDVAITGSMTEFMVEEPLARLEGTDLFYRSYQAGPATRWEYRLNVDFDNPQPDPLNPRRIADDDGELSEVTTAGWKRSAWLEPYAGEKRGTVEELTHESEILGNERKVEVYLPAGYAGGSERYPLVVAADGQSWRENGNLPNVLDHLIDGGARPVIVAFIHQPERTFAEFGPRSLDWVRMVTEEILPALDAKYRTLTTPESRTVLGAGSAGTIAALVALTEPDTFGKAAIASAFLGQAADQFNAAVAAFPADGPKPVFEVSWHLNDLHRADWNADIARDSKAPWKPSEGWGCRSRGAKRPTARAGEPGPCARARC